MSGDENTQLHERCPSPEWKHPSGAPDFRPSPHVLTRRTVLAGGGGLVAAGLAGLVGVTGLVPAQVQAIDWSSLYRDRMPDVSGLVREIEGVAFSGKRPLSRGDRVASGALVQVAKGGRVVVGLEDGSIFTVYGGSELELFLEKMSQGLLHLLAGALLMVAPKGSHYLIAGNDATFGIKGTVVFRKVISEDDRMMYGPGTSMAIPENADGYFCLCHGSVDFLHRTGGAGEMGLTRFHEDTAEYHNARFLLPAGEGDKSGLGAGAPPRLVKAPMLEHSDAEIRRLVALQDEPRHSLEWLRQH